MLAELRSKSQITLPKSIVASLGLEEGDQLDIREKDGVIYMMPVTVYPKGYIESLRTELTQLKEDIQYGKQPVFTSIDALIENVMLKITYTARFQKHYKTLTDAEKKLFRSKAVQIRDTMKTVF